MADEDLVVKARIDDELSAPLENIREDLDRVGNEATRSSTKASRASRGWSTFGKIAKGALIGIAAGAAAAAYATTRLLRSSFAEAREAEKIGNTTKAIIKATGGAAKVTEKQVGKLAERLSVMAGIDDEVIQQGANLLLTFKNVRNEAGKGAAIFDRATTAAVDLSAAGFGSIESGSKMLGKALNDPLKGITALSRAGVTFTAEQQEQIKGMVTANDLLGAQKIILGEVEAQVGGVAKAQATFGDRATVVWGNIQEKLGTALLPMLDRFQRWFVEKGGPALSRYVDVFEKRGIPALKRFGDRARELATEYLPQVKSTLGDVKDVVVPVAGAAKDMVDAFLGMPPWARKLLVGAGVGAVIAKKLKVPELASMGLKVASKAAPLPVWVVNNGDLPGGGKTPPGAVVPGGKPGAKPGPLIPGAKPGTLAGLAKGGSLALSRLVPFLGIGIGGDMGLGTDPRTGKPLEAATREQTEALKAKADAALTVSKYTLDAAGALDKARAKAAGFGDALDLVGAKKVNPEVRDTSIRNARDHLAKFVTLQVNAGRPITPYITISGYDRAMQQISTITSAIHSIPTAGVDNGLTYASGGTPRREYGGNVRKGEPVVVGERRAELFVPDRSGTILPRVPGGAGAGVTMERGAVTVLVEHAAADVDVERAVRRGIEDWLRDQRERT